MLAQAGMLGKLGSDVFCFMSLFFVVFENPGFSGLRAGAVCWRVSTKLTGPKVRDLQLGVGLVGGLEATKLGERE